MTATAPPATSLVEYFTLTRATALGIELGAARRKEVHDALAVGRQRGEAAETLWSNGHTAEGLRLAFSSLDDTVAAATALASPTIALAEPVQAIEPAPEAPAPEAPAPEAPAPEAGLATSDAEPAASDPAPEPTSTAGIDGSEAAGAVTTDASAEIPSLSPRAEPWRAVLLSRGVRPARVESVASALASQHAATLPRLDADISPALAELFPRVMAARHLVDGAVAPSAWSPGEIRWTRLRRVTGVILALVLAVVGLYFGLNEPEGTFTTASDFWAQSPTFGTDMAIDGRPETSWLLPDRATGWLEVRTSPARRVERVVLTNTANAPANDRGTQDYRLEIYAHGELARSIDGHFDWSETPQPVTHEVGMDAVDRVRLVVRSFHRSGGGLSEMDIQ